MRIVLTGPPSVLLDDAAEAIARHRDVPSVPSDSTLAVRRLNDRMLALAGCTRMAVVPDVATRLPSDVRDDLRRRARRVVEVRLGRTWVLADPAWAFTWSLWADALEPELVIVARRPEPEAVAELVDLGAPSFEVAAGLYSLYASEASAGIGGVRTMCADLSRLPTGAEAVDPADLEAAGWDRSVTPTDEVMASLERYRRAVVLDALTRVVDESELERRRRLLALERDRLEAHEAEILRAVRDPVEQLRVRLAEVMLDRSRLVQEEHDRRQERNRLFLEKRALQEECDALRARLGEAP